MRSFTWNRFPIKNLLIDSLLTPIVESTYLNSLNVCEIRSRVTEARHRHSRICKSSLLKWKHWPLTESAWYAWATTTKLMRFFFNLFYEVFPKQKWKYLRNENKMFLFRKDLQNENVFETKIKLFLFLKRNDFNLQTQVKVFPKRK